jgi:hypothetical protein
MIAAAVVATRLWIDVLRRGRRGAPAAAAVLATATLAHLTTWIV